MDEDEGRGRPLELFWDGLDPADPDEEPEAITLKEVVADIRQRMWERGWRPVEIYDHDRSVGFNGHSVNSPGKQPVDFGWTAGARQSPPAAVLRSVRIGATNTGLLCDGLRVIDIDVDDRHRAQGLRHLVERVLGKTPLVRVRRTTSRVVMVYRSPGDEPKKAVGNRDAGEKLEVLGRGQQVVVYGVHPDGAAFEWENGDAPWDFHRDHAPVAHESDVDAVLQQAAAILQSALPQSQPVRAAPSPSSASVPRPPTSPPALAPTPQHVPLSIEDIESALAVIPYQNYEQGVRIVAAVKAADPSPAAYAALDAWFRRQKSDYDPARLAEKWRNPLTRVGPGTLIKLAKEAHPRWISPSLQASRRTMSPARPVSATAASGGVPAGSALASGAPSSPLDPRPEVDALIRALNSDYAVVRVGGYTRVAYRTRNHELNRVEVHLSSAEEFRNWHQNKLVKVGTTPNGADVLKPAGHVWLSHPARRECRDGLVLDPTNTAPPTAFNLWQGWSTDPVPGDWSLLRTHIREVIAGGDPALDAYVMGWLAHAFQRPNQPAGVALVLRGKKGTGKGTIGNEMVKAWGTHGIHLTHAEHLTGKFNAVLRDVVFCFADEAFFAGDRTNENALKAIITEEFRISEQKGIDAVMVRNRIRLLMATNSDWAVPATSDERRYAVLDVSDTRIGDRAWFGAIRQQMQQGGRAAMIHDLLHHDLSTFDIFAVPETQALRDQRAASMRGLEAWWYEVLQRGYVLSSAHQELRDWPENGFVPTERLWRSYEQWFAKGSLRHKDGRVRLGTLMGKLGYAQMRPRGRFAVGEAPGGTLEHLDRPQGYKVGTLEEARARFGAAMKVDGLADVEGGDDAGPAGKASDDRADKVTLMESIRAKAAARRDGESR